MHHDMSPADRRYLERYAEEPLQQCSALTEAGFPNPGDTSSIGFT